MRPLRLAGFTLMELVMTIVILGFLSLILIPFVQSVSHSPDPMIREQAMALGQALMDEILAKRWDEHTPVGGGPIITGESPAPGSGTCGPPCTGDRLYCFYTCDHPGRPSPGQAGTIAPEVSGISSDGETRANFDDVDDYDGFSENGTFRDQNGDIMATLPGYSRSVTVRYIPSDSNPITATSPAGTTAGGTSATDTKRIVVTVTTPLKETFTLVAVSCNF